jgi:lipopolysaccharide/colanic/teichoic acid biosynthesis glycosyltransferase
MGPRLQFINVPDLYCTILGRVPLGAIDDLWLLGNISLRSKSRYKPIKRFLDILFSLVGLLVSAPLWPLLSIAVKLSSPGPVLFRQKRLGINGKIFTILKFRTMRINDNDFSPTGRADSRITPLGSFLRASRLDEIPQLVNIFLGDMSFVGPRPERPELAVELAKAIPFYNQRLLAMPGLTGWDQVSGEYHSPSIEDTYKKLQYDLYYLKNFSPFTDFAIVLRTVLTVFKRLGR